MHNASKTVFITGASSGFGKLTAKKFLREGWNVVATMRAPEKETELQNSDTLLLTRLDVTDLPSIEAAVEQALARFGRIDALVNNAGYGTAGFFEEAGQEEARKQMDTNFAGVVNVTQQVLPTMRRQKSGVIVNISSVAGLIGIPGMTLYSASKFAVEGLSEALGVELHQFGITVRLVEPGAFKTGFARAISFTAQNKRPDLDGPRATLEETLSKAAEKPPKPFSFGNPQKVADAIYDSATKKCSPFRRAVGKDAKMLLCLRKLLPGCCFSSMLRKTLVPDFSS